MNRLILFIVAMAVSILGFSQNASLKEQALEEFKAEHYDDAIDLLEQAVRQSPDDAEIYYYLGWFNHYRAYDSRPLKGYDYAYSKRIFEYLDKAIALNPNYGDAKYFYSAECGSLAMVEMQNKKAEKVKHYYELAYEKGTFPDWLIEYGRNLLAGCNENAIVFVGGDADLNICTYLQMCTDFRTDVTVIPIGLIDRPWYVSMLKNGLENCIRKINLSLTEDQIMDIRPFKWRATDVHINISSQDKLNFGLSEDFKMEWLVAPDLQSWRMHSKIEGEEETRRTFLSPQRAILLQIVEDNLAERPIYFSIGCDPSFLGGLNEYLRLGGLVSQLTPIKTNETNHQIDVVALEQLFKVENFTSYKTVKENNFPRISGMAIYGYPYVLKSLANHYRLSGKDSQLKQLAELYRTKLKVGVNEGYEQEIMTALEE